MLQAAEAAAREAGKLLLRLKKRPIAVDRDSRRDIKLAADRESEALILRALSRVGSIPFLAEESGQGGEERSDGLRWIVDPLDGSMNYARGIPFCCVSIGLWKGLKPILGVVHDFNRGETFSGLANGGAWLNKRPMKASVVTERSRAVLCTGLPTAMDYSRRNLDGLIARLRTFKKTRMLGAAALMLAYVAAGRVDAYQEQGIMLWDVAGALPILSGAKGRFELTKTKKLNCFNIKATNGRF